MIKGPVINAGIQVTMAAAKYFLQIYTFSQVPLETVGEIALVLTFVTSATFIAGFELHHHVNRPILLGQTTGVRGVRLRAVASLTILALAALAFPEVTQVDASRPMLAILLVAAFLEYVNLEIGRLLIICERYLFVTFCGSLRSLAPFIAGVTGIITLETVLSTWALMSLLMIILQVFLVRRRKLVTVSRESIGRGDIAAGLRFFLTGGVQALLPFVERLLVSRFFGIDALGLFVLVVVFVGVGNLVLQGSVWQPFIRRITRRFATPDRWRETMGLMLAVTIGIFATLYAGLLVFGSFAFELLDKPIPPYDLMSAIFLYGTAKASFTVFFYIYYANHAERILPYLQVAIAATVISGFFLAHAFALGLPAVFIFGAGAWLLFPMITLINHLPNGLRKKAF